MSSEEEPVAWLRRQVEARMALARHTIGLGNSAEWTEVSSGVLKTSVPDDSWSSLDGLHPLGDSSVTRLMEANDPQDTIARCEAELAILEAHDRAEHYCPIPVLPGRHSQLWTPEEGPCWTLRLVATGYRHHDGYADHWPGQG